MFPVPRKLRFQEMYILLHGIAPLSLSTATTPALLPASTTPPQVEKGDMEQRHCFLRGAVTSSRTERSNSDQFSTCFGSQVAMKTFGASPQKMKTWDSSLVVWWLGLCTANAGAQV